MARKKKIITEADGTPVEVDDETPETGKKVLWTQKAEDEGVFSEHGLHKAGDEVTTEYADLLIERGHATAVGE